MLLFCFSSQAVYLYERPSIYSDCDQLLLKYDVSEEFGTGCYCNSKTNVMLCDYYKL